MRNLKKLLVMVVVLGLSLAWAGCSRGMIRADAVGGLIQDVTTRHDKMLRGELKPEAISEEDKASYLRSSDLLRRTVKEAQSQ